MITFSPQVVRARLRPGYSMSIKAILLASLVAMLSLCVVDAVERSRNVDNIDDLIRRAAAPPASRPRAQ